MNAVSGLDILNELSIPEYADEAGAILKQNGWEEDLSGSNAFVYIHPDKDYVLKLYTPSDRAYTDFIKLVLAHPNKHFPKIYGKPLKVNRVYNAVRVEKLIPVQYGDEYNINLGTCLDSNIEWAKGRNDIRWEAYLRAKEYLGENPDMAVALELIKDHLLTKWSEDLHSANVMRRKDGTLVIIDPVR